MTEIELAYAAGIVDGEGTIGIYSHTGAKLNPRRKHPVMRVCLSVPQCDIRLPLWFKARFGGYVHSQGIPKLGRKEAFVWQLNGSKRTLPVLEALRPYLFLKRDRAEIAIAYCKQQKWLRHLPVAEQELEYAKRNALIAQLRAMNQRGTAPAETKRFGTERSCDSPNCTETNVQKMAETTISPERVGNSGAIQ